MAQDTEKAFERYEELQALYIELGYHLQMMQSEIERGEMDPSRPDSVEDNLNVMIESTRNIEFHLDQ